MAARAAEVAVLGNLHFDILVSAPDRPRKGETLLGSEWREKCGGKGGNQAIEAARQGVRVSMIGAVGDDRPGAQLVANLARHGVETAHVTIVPAARSGMSVAILDGSGDYGAVIVPGANWLLSPDHISAARDTLLGAAVLLLQNEAIEAVNMQAARLARSGGGRVVLNAAPTRETDPDLLAMVDVMIVNAVEAEMMGCGGVDSLAGAELAAERLLALAPSVIVTAGAAGLAIAQRGADPVRIAARRVRAVSSHGAGDAFVGALAARLAAGEALVAAAHHGNAAAARLVSTPEGPRSQRLGLQTEDQPGS